MNKKILKNENSEVVTLQSFHFLVKDRNGSLKYGMLE